MKSYTAPARKAGPRSAPLRSARLAPAHLCRLARERASASPPFMTRVLARSLGDF